MADLPLWPIVADLLFWPSLADLPYGPLVDGYSLWQVVADLPFGTVGADLLLFVFTW